jgi:tripartite-type tricarboxylate transporter receptor subunit TctC
MTFQRRTALRLLGAAAMCPFPGLAQSGYPSRPIRFVVPSVPGGATDILGRLMATGLAARWPQPVFVDNRPGAGTSIGAEFVSKSAPDGYTLLACGIASHAINPAVYKNIGYDPVKSFTPITLVATLPNVLLVNPSVPASNLKELIELLKANPEKYSYASVGNGTSPHLSAELLLQSAGLRIQHVPYKGSAPALVDLMGGQIQIGFDNLSGALPLVNSGKLKAIAVTTRTRSPLLPNVPAIRETPGLEDYEVASWLGLCAPAGLPESILRKISADALAVLRDPATQKKIQEAGALAAPMTPEEFGSFVASQATKFRVIAHRANLQLG